MHITDLPNGSKPLSAWDEDSSGWNGLNGLLWGLLKSSVWAKKKKYIYVFQKDSRIEIVYLKVDVDISPHIYSVPHQYTNDRK